MTSAYPDPWFAPIYGICSEIDLLKCLVPGFPVAQAGIPVERGKSGRGGLVTTYHDEQARSRARSWSRTRWLVMAGLLAAIAVVIVLVLLYAGGGGGSGGGGGY